jgi:hypothetical protein
LERIMISRNDVRWRPPDQKVDPVDPEPMPDVTVTPPKPTGYQGGPYLSETARRATGYTEDEFREFLLTGLQEFMDRGGPN